MVRERRRPETRRPETRRLRSVTPEGPESRKREVKSLSRPEVDSTGQDETWYL